MRTLEKPSACMAALPFILPGEAAGAMRPDIRPWMPWTMIDRTTLSVRKRGWRESHHRSSDYFAVRQNQKVQSTCSQNFSVSVAKPFAR